MNEDEEGVTYEDIRGALQRQRGANTPIELAKGFYADARTYLDELREEYENAHARDPGSKEVRILQDELFNAREALNDLFDARAKKILSHALSQASELDTDDLTEEERQLFHRVREEVDAKRESVLEGAQRGGAYELVRILDEMPSFTGADLRIYDVEPEDIVTLPEETADLLVDNAKAEPVQTVA